MQSACRSILVALELTAISLIAALPLPCQSPEPFGLRPVVPPGCREPIFHPAPAKPRNQISTARSFLRSDPSEERPGCDEPATPEEVSATAWHEPPVATASRAPMPAAKLEPTRRPAGEPGLIDIGEEGTNISRARDAVLGILKDSNSCSEWFRQGDSHVADTFSSLSIAVDENGSKQIIKERNDNGVWIEHGPYIARTLQDGGPGAEVTINGNGAFFQRIGDVYKLEWSGGIANYTGTWRHLHVGPFDGATLPAQVITFLHELAHVTAMVPADDSSVVGFARSQENTNLVLRHCQAQASSAGKQTKFVTAQR